MRRLLAIAVLAAACGPKPPTTTSPTGGEAKQLPDPDRDRDTSPYAAETWIAKLADPRESERAVTELEALGDPSAIGPLSRAWEAQDRPVRIIQVIIDLARPLTPADAKTQNLTAYPAGRPASWDQALPVLVRAVSEVDEANPRSVDSAIRAAEALGQAGLGQDALIALAKRPAQKTLLAAQVAALRALGTLASDRATSAAALVEVLGRDQPPRPAAAASGEAAQTYRSYLVLCGAAINALAELRVPTAAGPLVLAMYRTPELFMQARRALVATGPTAEAELRKAMRGDSAPVNRLFKANRLDSYCGDDGKAKCRPVSAREFYPAVVLGDFHDPAVVPELLAILKRPAQPVYYADGVPSPNTQRNAVFDALRRIGAPAAAAPVRALWKAKRTDVATRALAVATYPFVARDQVGVAELGAIAADRTADDGLRQEAATALARLSTDAKDIELLGSLAQQFLDRAAKGGDGATAYVQFARMYYAHIARIEIATRCKADLACFAASLSLPVDDAVANNTPYIKDLAAWTADEKRELAIAAADRALLEIGKHGAGASELTDALLAAAASEERLVRGAVLLALPKIAKLPCLACMQQLDAVVRAGAGKTTLADLTFETTILRDYFAWAGGRTPP